MIDHSRLSAKQRLDLVFTVHAAISVITGGVAFVMPHTITEAIMGSGHMVHAVVRLWAALTLAQGWLVWRTRRVVDAHVRKTFCQAYCVCFTLQTLALIRAHATSPDQHSILNLFSIFLFAVQASVYGYFIFFEKLNAFESLDKALG